MLISRRYAILNLPMSELVFYQGKLEFLSKLRRWLLCRCGGAIVVEEGRIVCGKCDSVAHLYERQPSKYAEAEC